MGVERAIAQRVGEGNSRSYADVKAAFTYGDANHKHAVTALLNGNTYTYDANGNMISRHVLEGTAFQNYTLSYDAENRLVQVQKNGATIAQFTFDADGKRVKSVMGSETILFVGAHYEVMKVVIGGTTTTTYIKYYMAGSTRIAMRKYVIPQNMTVEYMLSDHLGSTSLTADVNGNKVLEIRYKAWGEIRATWTSSPSTTLTYKLPRCTSTK